MNNIPTPHIDAKPGDFGKTVLMPGDPLRAKFIAETYLENPILVNNVRGIQGYSGNYKGRKISVMASGMGIPTIGIYSYELYNFYGVETIIRIGSAGGMGDNVNLRDLVIGMGAATNSNFASQFGLPGTIAPIADFDLCQRAVSKCKEKGISYHVGNLYSSDAFYDDSMQLGVWKKMGVLAVEMEAAGLYLNALRAGKKALAICTISDHPFKGLALSALDRQETFREMMEVALEIADY